MDNIRINIAYRNVHRWKDSRKRSDHIFERMKLRGIGVDQIKDAVSKGVKRIRKDSSIIAEYRWFKVVYREFIVKNIKKIYPITVIEV